MSQSHLRDVGDEHSPEPSCDFQIIGCTQRLAAQVTKLESRHVVAAFGDEQVPSPNMQLAVCGELAVTCRKRMEDLVQL